MAGGSPFSAGPSLLRPLVASSFRVHTTIGLPQRVIPGRASGSRIAPRPEVGDGRTALRSRLGPVSPPDPATVRSFFLHIVDPFIPIAPSSRPVPMPDRAGAADRALTEFRGDRFCTAST
ncbi:hypothetical protein VTN49DRAFT_1579 [Thermomyces lanuginosus]|uniref:uncharacterized protein n=1 Tax=Thermomyces lanuginosus TaxID=5541 RepID=UPI0037426A6B